MSLPVFIKRNQKESSQLIARFTNSCSPSRDPRLRYHARLIRENFLPRALSLRKGSFSVPWGFRNGGACTLGGFRDQNAASFHPPVAHAVTATAPRPHPLTGVTPPEPHQACDENFAEELTRSRDVYIKGETILRESRTSFYRQTERSDEKRITETSIFILCFKYTIKGEVMRKIIRNLYSRF